MQVPRRGAEIAENRRKCHSDGKLAAQGIRIAQVFALLTE